MSSRLSEGQGNYDIVQLFLVVLFFRSFFVIADLLFCFSSSSLLFVHLVSFYRQPKKKHTQKEWKKSHRKRFEMKWRKSSQRKEILVAVFEWIGWEWFVLLFHWSLWSARDERRYLIDGNKMFDRDDLRHDLILSCLLSCRSCISCVLFISFRFVSFHIRRLCVFLCSLWPISTNTK